MSEDNKQDEVVKEEGQTFDMYHFFSRKDVILVAAVIIALLLYFLSKHFTATSV